MAKEVLNRFDCEQAIRARKLWAEVVLTALDDAIADDEEARKKNKRPTGADQIAHWARSMDGRKVLSLSGIDPNERVVHGLAEFVAKGVRTASALGRGETV